MNNRTPSTDARSLHLQSLRDRMQKVVDPWIGVRADIIPQAVQSIVVWLNEINSILDHPYPSPEPRGERRLPNCEHGNGPDCKECYRESHGESCGDQAPIARVTVKEAALGAPVVTAKLYAPGLPVGEHDLYCVPVASEPSDQQHTITVLCDRLELVNKLACSGGEAEKVLAEIRDWTAGFMPIPGSAPEPGGQHEVLVNRLRNAAQAYPLDMFSEVTPEERTWLRTNHPGLQDRIAASMGRHLGKLLAEAADALESTSSHELAASVERGRSIIEALRSFMETSGVEISVAELDWAQEADDYLAGKSPETKRDGE